MSYIDSVTEINHDIQYRSGKVGTCPPYSFTYDAPVPAVGQLFVPDSKAYESPKPPKDRSSWSQIKKSGFIKMTPLHRRKWSERYTPVGVQHHSFSLGWPNCQGKQFADQVVAHSTWVQWYAFGVNLSRGSVVFGDDSVAPDIDAELNSLRASVVSDNLQTYDILTELSEAKETAAMIIQILRSVRNPLKAFTDFKKSIERQGNLSPAQIKRKIEDKWMEYRYAIMPAMYSLQDIAKMLKEKDNIYKTSRDSRSFAYERTGKIDRSVKGIQLYASERVEIRLSAVGKASYDPAELHLRLFDQLGINPFVTAWELIPLSFVIDWFANIGDWVLAQTSAVTDGAQQRVFCQSVKQKVDRRIYMYANLEFQSQRSYGTAGVVDSGVYTSVVDEEVYQFTSESYDRSLFVPTDVRLQSDVFLNWKRMIDAWVLGQKPVIKALRSLK